MIRQDLPNLLYKTIKSLGSKAVMIDIFKKFWKLYSEELKKSGDLFYTWNYDIRWAATELRKQKRMKPASKKENPHGLNMSPKGVWEII
ncbi:MAG: hypothetical protein FWD54_02575 [Endomicrobia bacterium]|nr:hypothetical protein [Endomicrobiia bacterium]